MDAALWSSSEEEGAVATCSPSGGQTKCLVTLMKYDGTTAFETFWAQFQNVVEWTKRDQLFYLKSCLKDQAAQALCDYGKEVPKSRTKLTKILKERFGGEGQKKKYRMELKIHRRRDRFRAALQYSPCSLDPMPAATLRRISTKALSRYQVILLGEQRHIRCEQLVQGCCPNNSSLCVSSRKEVDGRMMAEVCKLFGITKLKTSPDKPSTNQVERFHKAMNAILAKLCERRTARLG